MPRTEAFLDSTAIAARVLEDRDALPRLLEMLASYESRVTSQYVFMEIRRGLMRNLVFLFNCARNAEEFSEVLNKVEALLATPRRYLPRTIVQNLRGFFQGIQHERLAAVLTKHGDDTLSEYLLSTLTSALRMRIRNWFPNAWSLVDRVINELNCYPDLPPVKMVDDQFDATMPFCETLAVPCRVAEFGQERRADLEEILSAVSLQCADKETQDRVEALRTVLCSPEAPRRHVVCWDLGDALVCLEAPSGADIVNANPRHMGVICEALGKRSIHW